MKDKFIKSFVGIMPEEPEPTVEAPPEEQPKE